MPRDKKGSPEVQRDLARQREDRAWQLRRRGWSDQRIADQLAEDGLGRVTRQAVGQALRRARARVLKEMGERIKAETEHQLDLLNTIEADAWDAWERSKEESRRMTAKTVQPPPPAVLPGAAPPPPAVRTEKSLTTEQQCGDPSYLHAAMAAGDRKRKILGLDAPTRHKVAGDDAPGAVPIAVEHSGSVGLSLSHLTDEELELADRLGDRIAAAPAGANGHAHAHDHPG
jgi:hypothetical protein